MNHKLRIICLLGKEKWCTLIQQSLAAVCESVMKYNRQEFRYFCDCQHNGLLRPQHVSDWITSTSYPVFCRSPPSVFFAASISRFLFFRSVEFPLLFRLLRRDLRIVTWENNASSCFGCATSAAPPQPSFLWVTWSPGGRLNSTGKASKCIRRQPLVIRCNILYSYTHFPLKTCAFALSIQSIMSPHQLLWSRVAG